MKQSRIALEIRVVELLRVLTRLLLQVIVGLLVKMKLRLDIAIVIKRGGIMSIVIVVMGDVIVLKR